MLRRTTTLLVAAMLAGCGGGGHTTPKPPLTAARRGATLTIHYAQNVLRARAAALARRSPKFVDPLGDTLEVTSSIPGGFYNGSGTEYPSATATYSVAPDASGNQTLNNVPVFDGSGNTLTVAEYLNGVMLATVTVHTTLSASGPGVLDQPDGTIDAPLTLQITYGELIVNGDVGGANLPFDAGTSAVSLNYDTLGGLGLDCPSPGQGLPYANYLTHTVQISVADAAGAYMSSGSPLLPDSAMTVTVVSDNSTQNGTGPVYTANQVISPNASGLNQYPISLGYISGSTSQPTILKLNVQATMSNGSTVTIPVTIEGTPGSMGVGPNTLTSTC